MITVIIQTISWLFIIYLSSYIIPWLLRYLYTCYVYRRIPGPTNIPFIGAIIRLMAKKSVYTQTLIDISNEHKDVSFYNNWLGTTPYLIFHKYEHLNVILIRKMKRISLETFFWCVYTKLFFSGSKNTNKSFEYSMLHDWLHFGLLTSGGAKWTHRRKLLTPSFHFDILKSYLLTINEEADVLVKQIAKCNLNNNKIHLLPFITRFTLDTICATAMGEHLNTQNDEGNDYARSVQDICDVMIYRTKSPWLWPNNIFYLTHYGRIQKKALRVVHEFTRSIIDKRASDFHGLSTENNRRIAFLDVLLNAKLNDPNLFTHDDIQEEVDTFMFEGHDTTKSAINYTLYTIATHAQVQKKVHQEIDELLSDSELLTSDSLAKFEYLECVIKESLRLYPPVPIIGRVLDDDVIVDGKKLLKNTQVSIFIYQIHRDERVFYEADKFKPERFQLHTHHPHAYIPFSASKRNCIGQRFALMEIKVALIKLLKKFEIKCDQKMQDIKVVFEVTLRSENEILFSLKRR